MSEQPVRSDLTEAPHETADCALLDRANRALLDPTQFEGWPPQGASGATLVEPIRIGKYEIRRLIAAGGMGSVYEAVQDQPRRVVALKILRAALPSAAAVKRFEKEAQLLARLQHPGIAQVIEAGTHERGERRIPYIAMEFVNGARPLTVYADAHRLERRARLALFVDVCDAVHHGHTRGIIHRDLKPSNILVDQSGRVKVIDLGVSRTLDADPASYTVAMESGQIIGTLQYMAPEQCERAADVGAPADIYALGIVLYELLCDRLPYQVSAASLADAVQLIREAAPLDPSRVDRTLRGDLGTIILKALHKSPARRYASAAELAEDVRRHLRGDPIVARRDSPLYVFQTHARKFVARHQITTALLACLIAVATTATIGARLIADWSPINNLFIGALARLFPPNAPDLMNKVRIITFRDGTDVEALASSAGVEGVRAGDRSSRRRLHAKLAELLRDCGAHVVVFDIEFPTDTDHDDALATSIELLHKAGIPVVIAASGWLPLPRMSGTIRRHVSWGSPTIDQGSWMLPWSLVLFAQTAPQADPLPSLALRSVAAYYLKALGHPDGEVAWECDFQMHTVTMRFYRRDPAAPAVRIPVGQPITLKATHVVRPGPDGQEVGLNGGPWTGTYQLEVPSQQFIDSRELDLDYAAVLGATKDELREWFAGRVVVIGNADAEAKDVHRYLGDRWLPGCYAHAVGIDALLRGKAGVLYPGVARYGGINLSRLWAMELAAAALGAVLAVVSGSSLRRRALYLLLAAVGISGLSLLTYSQFRYLWNPLLPIIAMVLAALVMSRAAAVRHRVLG